MIKKIEFIITIVAPVGKLNIYDKKVPNITDNTDTMEDINMVSLKPLETKSAVTVGKIIILEISIVPTTLIPNTTVIEVKIEIK